MKPSSSGAAASGDSQGTETARNVAETAGHAADVRRRSVLAAGAAGVFAGLSGCLGDGDRSLPSTPSGSWPQHMRDGANTAATAATAPSRGNLAWTSDAFTRWPPVAVDDEVYIGNVDPNPGPKVVALDATDGSERWRVDVEEASHYTSAVVGEYLVAAFGDRVVALDRESGDREWSATVTGTVSRTELTAAPAESLVLVPHDADRDGRLTALDAATGEERWSEPLSGTVLDPPAVRGEGVFVAADSALYRLDIADGSEVWRRSVGSVALGPSATAAGLLVAADGDLAVHDADTGDRIRVLDGYDGEAHGVAVADGTAYWLTDEHLSAVAVTDGTDEWRLDAEGCQEGLCVGRETVVAPVQYEGFDLETAWPAVAAFDRDTGDVRWYYHIDGFDVMFTTPPVLVDGAVYVAANTIDAVGALGDVPPSDEAGLL
ncbi:outer membrane protein assembly factor BamB family protein [Halorubrum tebenquichense]|uniref:Pyrrolo-quinoline quinone beta-propeller repeat-containing protein n=1 Tax=Halorubrum tebenquichense DSM 14210 TaxID=1227485 RepID=M0E2S4_9EURY|nr:PQQ-binding-like beta-propeller repeat protein [Halorubrum tebenquichense]ELZ42090.1 Pyrrolo-quinoline quinone beta-propeller repeat-containing protein [Halorubrum tebenquichense DSM 14210]